MSLFSLFDKSRLPNADEALPGRQQSMPVPAAHFVNGHSLTPPFPDDHEQILFGMGCFWGAECKFWNLPGVYSTAVGYSAGFTPNPSYEEVCSGRTAHNEVVLVVYQPQQIAFEALLKVFWESHDPTQGMRQGNDRGSQYRSGIYCFSDSQIKVASATKERYQQALKTAGQQAQISSEIIPASTFFYAEDYHQQYLAKNPNGYCGLGGIGVPYS